MELGCSLGALLEYIYRSLTQCFSLLQCRVLWSQMEQKNMRRIESQTQLSPCDSKLCLGKKMNSQRVLPVLCPCPAKTSEFRKGTQGDMKGTQVRKNIHI